MLFMTASPVMRRPSREMTAETAHPEGMWISPSRFMKIAFFPENTKGVHFTRGQTTLAK